MILLCLGSIQDACLGSEVAPFYVLWMMSSSVVEDDEEEILVIEVESRYDVYSKFDVYVNDEDESPTLENRTRTEYAESFVNVPHRHGGKNGHHLKKTTIKFGISELIDDLDANDDEGIDVIFVPRTGTDSMIIKDVRIEFQD